MDNVSDFIRFFDIIYRAHLCQKGIVATIGLSIDGENNVKPLTLEFEILPPKDEVTEKSTGRKKR